MNVVIAIIVVIAVASFLRWSNSTDSKVGQKSMEVLGWTVISSIIAIPIILFLLFQLFVFASISGS